MKNRTTLGKTFANMWGDYIFWLKLNHKKAGISSYLSFLLLPGTTAIYIYRIAHWFDGLNIRLVSRIMQNIGIMLTGTDLNPRSEIGKGFILFHTPATAFTGKMGENAVSAGALKAGGDGSDLDIGAGPGLPVIGDNVQFGVDILILGPVRIGNGCWILSRASVFKDIPDGSIVAGTPGRVVGKAEPGSNMFERKCHSSNL